MFSGRQIWMVTTNRRRSQVATAMVIHLLSLTKSIREQQTQTLMEKVWTNGRKALIKSPRLSASFEPSFSLSQAPCWTFRSPSGHIFSSSFVDNVHWKNSDWSWDFNHHNSGSICAQSSFKMLSFTFLHPKAVRKSKVQKSKPHISDHCKKNNNYSDEKPTSLWCST